MAYKFYTFHWAHFRKGQILSQADGFYYTSDMSPKAESIRQHLKDLINDQNAELRIQNIKKISKVRYELLSGKPFEAPS